MTDVTSRLQEAISTMYGNTDSSFKAEANEYLLRFQRSDEAWKVIFPLLVDENVSLEMKMFVAQTLRSKVQYDFGQLPEESFSSLKDSIIQALLYFNDKQKLITTQLCLALAYFALQDLKWDNAVGEIINTLSSNAMDTLLEFLKVLPEEMLDVRRTPLTEEEFGHQTKKLIDNSVEQVLYILTSLADNKTNNSTRVNQMVLGCIQSWIVDVPINQILTNNSLCLLVFEGLTSEDTFDTAVDCLSTIIAETDTFDEHNLPVVKGLYNQLIGLQPLLEQSQDDLEKMERFVMLFSTAAEAWHVYIAAMPYDFKPLVDIMLRLTSYDDDLDVVKYTFKFWYDLKSLLTTGARQEARILFTPTYTELVNVMIKHLRYPTTSQSTDLAVLFNNDRDAEDKFKDFRYDMGDVLKDCCAVIGADKALSIPFNRLQQLMEMQAQGQSVMWQETESSLFSMRAMAKEVGTNEKKMLPQIMHYLVKLPENSKIRYAATLVLGRYTEWTAKHPEFLEEQLNYIIGGFQLKQDLDVIIAASHALKYFCMDCSSLLTEYLEQLFNFYSSVESSLDIQSLYDVTEGIAYVLKEQREPEKLYNITSMFWNPILEKLLGMNDMHSSNPIEMDQIDTKIADTIELITIYVDALKPRTYKTKEHPVAKLLMENVWPLIARLVSSHGRSVKVSERCMKLVRRAMQSFWKFLLPVLQQTAEMLIYGFNTYHNGCYLWVSGALIKEYASDEDASEEVASSVWHFSMKQIDNFYNFFSGLSERKSQDYPDLVEDFYRMMGDILMFSPVRLIRADTVVQQVYQTALKALQIYHEYGAISSILQFLVDFYSWGFDTPPISLMEDIPADLKLKIQNFALTTGQEIVSKLMYGLIFSFPSDCWPEANELITKIIKLSSLQGGSKPSLLWIDQFLSSLPQGSVSEREKLKLLSTVESAVNIDDTRTVRSSIRDFISWYKRKNVDRAF
ncbi:hypothetical protein FOA43_004399 [Brettanomyces nanus]|uniref:Importin N-terminal domain-containing protein n=1 Tax=Eeniella nana TaxID=13502 RepID=A0A875SA93_EENNA|nr:uncharacterized protein FOA43_004399 [Brettanomyces nanus]QPG77005.1 hypothetical protein FOA43_004399 [Brettanomyces nanus]